MSREKGGLHVRRHSAASAMIRASASPKALQTILGHQSGASRPSVYGQVFEQDVAALAERLETDRVRLQPGSVSH
jgi:integrase